MHQHIPRSEPATTWISSVRRRRPSKFVSLGISIIGNPLQIQCVGCRMVVGWLAWNFRMATTGICSSWMATRCLTREQTGLFGTTAMKDSHSWLLVEIITVEKLFMKGKPRTGTEETVIVGDPFPGSGATALSRHKRHSAAPEQIRQRAFAIHKARGGGPGKALDDWLQAEREFLAEQERPV